MNQQEGEKKQLRRCEDNVEVEFCCSFVFVLQRSWTKGSWLIASALIFIG